ncbi:glycoside hydrolase [Pelomyxa schiedti]|nr:glycoside hydrolase [Pelomyxa schiedti]
MGWLGFAVVLWIGSYAVCCIGASTDNPVADPTAVVVQNKARFTVLTDRMIRMEWSRTSTFEDSATFVVLNRLTVVPQFSLSQTSSYVKISTEYLTLTYMDTGHNEFNSSNLQISVYVDGTPVIWNPSSQDTGNLLGTVRTLDDTDGFLNLDCDKNLRSRELYCTYGIVSQLGWTLWDDTDTPLFDNSEYQWPRDRASSDTIDWYLFGYGHDYRGALYDFTLISGKIPLPPRFAFGIFFSRYWAYSDYDTREIVTEYEVHQTPLDVVVTDMDWHITYYKEADQGVKDQAGETIGWTGYTWDDHLFPHPEQFTAWCKQKGLKNTLNLHPASGVQPWEDKYEPMATAMGIDPSTQQYVPFDIVNSTYSNNWLDIVLKPVEDQGIDFWWLDWQQGWNGNPNPTIMLNYVFFTNSQRIGVNKRGMILHRWGGMGNHRYQVGFSGDVIPSWSSLNYQPHFTLTAANVLYGYWSHDIGGHTNPCPTELYTRWVQWGVWSPIFRTHCTKEPNNDRRIWVYPLENFEIMRDAIVLRSRMIPYIYTQARLAYDTGVSIVHPMYYDWASEADSYTSSKTQFMFGTDVLVAPITSPLNVRSQTAQKSIWIPPGTWIEWFSGNVFVGSSNLDREYTLHETPVFVKAGAVIPMLPSNKKLLGSAQSTYTALHLTIFPYKQTGGSTTLYEDDGVSDDYMSDGGYALTDITYTVVTDQQVQVLVSPSTGSVYSLTRIYNFSFVGIFPPTTVSLNGQSLSYVYQPSVEESGWSYDGSTLTMTAWSTTKFSVTSSVTLVVNLPKGQDLSFGPLVGYTGCLSRLQLAKSLLDQQWGTGVYNEDYYNLLSLGETGEKITKDLTTAYSQYTTFPASLTDVILTMTNLTSISESVKTQVLTWLQSCA